MSKIRRVGYILTAVLAAAAISAFVWKPKPPSKFVGLTGTDLPLVLGSYSGVDVPVDAATLSEIPSADIIQRRYTAVDGNVIDVTVIGGTGRNQLHDPRSCLVGDGWQIENDHVEYLPGTSGVPVRNCQISNTSVPGGTLSQSDLMYLYVVDQHPIASASTIRWTLLKSDLLEQNDDPVYFIRAVASVPAAGAGSNSQVQEHERLASFTTQVWKVLSPIIDRGERT